MMFLQEKSWRFGLAHKTAQVSIINFTGCSHLDVMERLKVTDFHSLLQISLSRFLLYQAWCLVKHKLKREENCAFLCLLLISCVLCCDELYISCDCCLSSSHIKHVVQMCICFTDLQIHCVLWPDQIDKMWYSFESKMLPWCLLTNSWLYPTPILSSWLCVLNILC